MTEEFYRIQRLPPYVESEQKLRQAARDVKKMMASA